MASRRKSAREVRSFRSAIAVLKKKGLVSPTIDARKIKPTRHYRGLVTKYKSVVEGKQTTVKIPKSKTSALKELGYDVRRERAVIDKWPGQKIIRDKRDVKGFRVRHPGGIEGIELPGPRGKHTNTYLNRVRKTAEKMHRPGERVRYAAKFFGNETRRSFPTLDQLIEYLERYASIESAEDESDRELINEQIQNLAIYRVPAGTKWPTKRKKKLGRK